MDNGDTAFSIKRLRVEDISLLRELTRLFETVFETPYPTPASDLYLHKLLSKPEFICLVILSNGQVAGGLTAYELPMHYSDRSEIFLYDLAIGTYFQRKGLGRQLITALREHCRQQGIRELFVAANEEDKHALDFYRATGGTAERVVHFNYTSDNDKH
jgi:aminoglycoside 3-N-acetyltransferase I